MKKTLTFLLAMAIFAGFVLAQPGLGRAKAVSTPAQSTPGYQGFENGLDGWTVVDNNYNDQGYYAPTTWALSMSGSHSGQSCVSYQSRYDGSNEWLISPLLSLPGREGDTVTLSWWLKGTGSYGGSINAKIVVLIASDVIAMPTAFASADTLSVINVTTTTYTEYYASLAEYAGQNVRLAFVVAQTNDYNEVYLDDIFLKAAITPLIAVDGPQYVTTNTQEHFVANFISGSDDNLWVQWVSRFVDSQVSVSSYGPYTDTADIIWQSGGFDTLEIIAENRDTMFSMYYPIRVYDCGMVSNYPYSEDFESGFLNCWTTSPANGWRLYHSYGENAFVNSGTKSIMVSDSSVDQWFISQQFSVETPELELSWYDAAITMERQTYYYVLVSQSLDATDLQSFIVVDTFIVGNDDYFSYTKPYSKHAISLANYYGTSIYVAFRIKAKPSDVTANTLYIDDFRVGQPLPPDIMLEGDQNVMVGDTASFKAIVTSSLAYTVNWDFGDSVTVIGTGDSVKVIWGNVLSSNRIYSVSATNTYGTTVKHGEIYVLNCQPITEYPYVEDFSNRNNGFVCWEGIGEYYSDWTYSYYGGYASTSVSGNNERWLISQSFVVPSGSDYLELSWYTNEPTFKVLISTNGRDNRANFTDTVFVGDGSQYNDWVKQSIGLYNYAGDTINVAFVVTGTGGWNAVYANLDDVRIGSPSAPSVILTTDNNETVFNSTQVVVNAVVNTTAPLTSYVWTADSAVIIDSNANSATFQWPTASSGTYTYKYVVCNGFGCDSATGEVEVVSCLSPVTSYPYNVDYTIPGGYDICWAGQGIGWDVDSQRGYIVSKQEGDEPADNILQGQPFAIPASGDYEFEWVVSGLNSPYYALVADDGTTADTIYSGQVNSANWNTYRVSLAAYAGHTVSLYFRHTDAGSHSELYIQAIKIHTVAAPTVTIAVPSSAHAGAPVEVSATVVTSDPNVTYAWTFTSGTPATATTPTVSVTWSAAGTYPVSLVVTNSAGSVTANANITIVDCANSTVTEFPYNENFDAGVGCWNTIDGDGDGNTWESLRYRMNIINNVGEMSRLAHNGSADAVASWSYLPISSEGEGHALSAHNYLYSPAIELPADVPMKIVFFAKSYNSDFPDHLAVKISTTGTSAADFNRTIMPRTAFSSANFERKEFSLAAYAGSTVYIAFEHVDSNNFGIIIDDVNISSAAGIGDVDNVPVTLYPNPVTDRLTVEADALRAIEVLDMCGRVVAVQTKDNTVSLAALASGIYMVRVVTDGGVAVRKVVKQ